MVCIGVLLSGLPGENVNRGETDLVLPPVTISKLDFVWFVKTWNVLAGNIACAGRSAHKGIWRPRLVHSVYR